jgi:hypothetical protein
VAKGEIEGDWIWSKYCTCIYKNRILKLVKIVFKGVVGTRKSNRGAEFDQSTLYECMKISQWNAFVQLIYTNKKLKTKSALYKNT